MRNQPTVHHVPGCLPDEVILHKLLVLIQPGLHPRELSIVANANRWTTAGTDPRWDSTRTCTRSARMKVVVVQQVILMGQVMVMVVMVQQVVMASRSCVLLLVLLLKEQRLVLLLMSAG